MQVIDLPREHPFRLRAIDPAQLHTIWPQVRMGLDAVKAKHDPDWLPEDIYTSLKANAATLLVADEADGFLILQKQQRFYGACVLVWVCYAPGEMSKFSRSVYGELERLAREVGAMRIEMHGRKGWERDPFWTTRETVYIHEVK
jgi:hypothetical protein